MIDKCQKNSMAVSNVYLPPLTQPKGSKVKYFNFATIKAIVIISCRNFACRQSSNKYETFQKGLHFEGLGLSLLCELRGWERGKN